MSLRSTLNNTELPDDIKKLIKHVVRRTRLRRHERADVANELIVHFEDAIEEGVEPDQAITDYGNVKTAAKLLRKAKKRQRWWFDRAFVPVFKWSSISFVCFSLLYTSLVVRAMNRYPTITVNYLAMLNETAAAVPEEDRAWPYYREASIALRDNPWPWKKLNELTTVRPDWPGQEGWSVYATWISQHQDTLSIIRNGASKKGLGYIATGFVAMEDQELWPDEFRDRSLTDTRLVTNIKFRSLEYILQMEVLLSFDAKEAAEAGESERCLSNIQAMLRIAVHCREYAGVESDIRSLIYFQRAFRVLSDVLEHEPELFSDAQILIFKEQLQALDSEFIVRFEGERIAFLDLLQQTFTDDGNGEGVLIPTKWMLLRYAAKGSAIDEIEIHLEEKVESLLSTLLSPFRDIVHASRKELVDEYDRRLAILTSRRGLLLFDWSSDDPELDELEDYDFSISNMYFVVDLFFPLFTKNLHQEDYVRAQRDGMIAMLYAIEQHRKTGKWPTSLSDIGVIDPWSGKPLLIADVDGAPVIYSIGVDQDDDCGVEHRRAKHWGDYPRQMWNGVEEAPDGDWVLWTLAKNDE